MKDTSYRHHKLAIKAMMRLIIDLIRVTIDSISFLELIEDWNSSSINHEQAIVKNKRRDIVKIENVNEITITTRTHLESRIIVKIENIDKTTIAMNAHLESDLFALKTS